MVPGNKGTIALGTTYSGPSSNQIWGDIYHLDAVAGTTYDFDIHFANQYQLIQVMETGQLFNHPVTSFPSKPTDTVEFTPSESGDYQVTVAVGTIPATKEALAAAQYSMTVTKSTVDYHTDGDITVFGLSRDDFLLDWVHGSGKVATIGIEKAYVNTDGSVGVILAPGVTSADVSHSLMGFGAPHIPGGAGDSFLRIHCG